VRDVPRPHLVVVLVAIILAVVVAAVVLVDFERRFEHVVQLEPRGEHRHCRFFPAITVVHQCRNIMWGEGIGTGSKPFPPPHTHTPANSQSHQSHELPLSPIIKCLLVTHALVSNGGGGARL
jgi:hypothetical protein